MSLAIGETLSTNNKQMNEQTNKQTNKLTNKQTNKQTNKYVHRVTQFKTENRDLSLKQKKHIE